MSGDVRTVAANCDEEVILSGGEEEGCEEEGHQEEGCEEEEVVSNTGPGTSSGIDRHPLSDQSPTFWVQSMTTRLEVR